MVRLARLQSEAGTKDSLSYERAEKSPEFSTSTGNNFWESSGICLEIITSTFFSFASAAHQQFERGQTVKN